MNHSKSFAGQPLLSQILDVIPLINNFWMEVTIRNAKKNDEPVILFAGTKIHGIK